MRALVLVGLAAACLCGTAQAAPRAHQSFSLRLDGRHLAIPSAWRPGAVRIAVTAARGEQELTLLRFRRGYDLARFEADGRLAQGRRAAARAALARVMAGTEWVGGVDVFPGVRAAFATVVRPGVYYLAELNERPLLREIHVGGAPVRGLPPAAATVREVDSGYRIAGTLRAHGTIAIHNAGRQPHRLNLEPLKAGTTLAQVDAFLRGSGAGPNGPAPSFARPGPELGTALVGPGETIELSYSIPSGEYALLRLQQDARTGKQQVLEGMVAVARFR